MPRSPTGGSIARGLLLFWALWLSVVFASNAADALKELGLLPEGWRFVSGNYAFVKEALAIYTASGALATLLFAGVLVTQLAAATLFWRALAASAEPGDAARWRARLAFASALALFAAFLVTDEVLIVYDRMANLETTHFLILCALLLSLLTVERLAGEEAS